MLLWSAVRKGWLNPPARELWPQWGWVQAGFPPDAAPHPAPAPADHNSVFPFLRPQTRPGPLGGAGRDANRSGAAQGKEGERTLVVCVEDHTHHVTCLPRCLRVFMCSCVLLCLDADALGDFMWVCPCTQTYA